MIRGSVLSRCREFIKFCKGRFNVDDIGMVDLRVNNIGGYDVYSGRQGMIGRVEYPTVKVMLNIPDDIWSIKLANYYKYDPMFLMLWMVERTENSCYMVVPGFWGGVFPWSDLPKDIRKYNKMEGYNRVEYEFILSDLRSMGVYAICIYDDNGNLKISLFNDGGDHLDISCSRDLACSIVELANNLCNGNDLNKILLFTESETYQYCEDNGNLVII